MAINSPIFTNKALKKMKQWGLSEGQVLDAFNSGRTERANFPGGRWSAIKKYSGYEIGVNYDRAPDGRYKIITVWKRRRR